MYHIDNVEKRNTNVVGIDPATSDLRLNFVRNEKTFITFNPHLELTGHRYLSPSLGYNSQRPICASRFFLHLLRTSNNKFLR